MLDSFVLVAPIYLLGVIALVGFVGCAEIVGLEEWPADESTESAAPGAPTNVHAEAGDNVVTLFWDPYPDALLFEIDREISPPGVPPASYNTHLPSATPASLPTIGGFLAYEDHDVTNGITYHYVVRAVTGDGTGPDSPDIEATPKSPFGPFVESFVAGSDRASEDRWFGFAFQALEQGITVRKLGRFYDSSHTDSHEITIIEAATSQILGTATVTDMSEELDGFKYADVDPPVDLKQNDEYFVVSHESTGYQILDQDTTVMTRPEATVTNAVESATLVAFTTAGGPGHTYGPVNFQY